MGQQVGLSEQKGIEGVGEEITPARLSFSMSAMVQRNIER